MTTHHALPSRITDDELADLALEQALAALLVDLLEHAPRDRARWPLVLAAAASVAAAVAVPVIALDDGAPAGPSSRPGGTAQTAATSAASAASATTSAPVTPPTESWHGPSRYVVLTAPGWRATQVDTDPSYGVGLDYSNGGRELSIESVRAPKHASLIVDARASSPQQSRQVLGEEAAYFANASQQQFAYLPVHDGYGLRISAAFTTEAEFADLLTKLRYVDAEGFATQVPAGTLEPGQTRDVAAELLAGVEQPPGWTAPEVGGWNSRQGLAEQLLQPLGCAWAEAFVAAREAGDDAGRSAAIDAFTASPDWSMLAHDPGRYAISLAAMRRDGSDTEVTGSLCAISIGSASDLSSVMALLD